MANAAAADAGRRIEQPRSLAGPRTTLVVAAIVLALGSINAPTMPPLRALCGLAAAAGTLAGTLLAYRALERRERWALWYVVAILVVAIAVGTAAAVGGGAPRTAIIPIGAIVAVILLHVLHASWGELSSYASEIAPSRALVALAFLAGIVVPVGLPPAAAALPDPTQVASSDLSLLLVVSCGSSSTNPGAQTVSAVVTVTWARHDLLPRGLVGSFAGQVADDPILVETVGSANMVTPPGRPDTWALYSSPPEQPWLAPGFLPASPAGAAITLAGGPPDTLSSRNFSDALSPSYAVSVAPEQMTAGQPYTMTWTFIQNGPLPWPSVRVRYVHEYRFAVDANAGCGETAQGSETT